MIEVEKINFNEFNIKLDKISLYFLQIAIESFLECYLELHGKAQPVFEYEKIIYDLNEKIKKVERVKGENNERNDQF
jgi:hypothetical protein